jgi:hypothetical protein
MSNIFWELTDEEIMHGIDLISDTGEDVNHPMNIFNHDASLQILAGMWLNCDKDRILMKLTYADEIQVLPKIIDHTANRWYAPAGLNRGIIAQ